jgi:predicted amidohydrolase YtcJ
VARRQLSPTGVTRPRGAGHPIALVRVDGHAIWQRRSACRGHRSAHDRIRREGSSSATLGEPTGVLIDTARVIRRVEPRTGLVHLEEAVKAAVADCLSVGLTGVHEMGRTSTLAATAASRPQARFRFATTSLSAAPMPAAWQAALDEGRAAEPTPGARGRREAHGGQRARVTGRRCTRRAATTRSPRPPPLRSTSSEPAGAPAAERASRSASTRSRAAPTRSFSTRSESVLAGRPSAAGGRLAAAPARTRATGWNAQILAAADIPRFRALGVLRACSRRCTSDHASSRRGASGPSGWQRLRAALAPDRDRHRQAARTSSRVAESVPRHPRGDHAPPQDADPKAASEQRMTRPEAVRAFTSWNAYAAHQAVLGTLEPGSGQT